MKVNALIVSVGSFSLASALPKAFNTDPATAVLCKEPRVRKEWRSLTAVEQRHYIQSVQCLFSKPPLTKERFPIVTSRYEDFVALHANATAGGRSLDSIDAVLSLPSDTGIHGTGPFLPWHRYLVWVYESTLRDECGYTGTQPYWDWSLDTPPSNGSFLKSPLFDPVTGFGGSGSKVEEAPATGILGLFSELFKLLPFPGFGGPAGCVENGPFRNLTLHIGPLGSMVPNNPRCLTRKINEVVGNSAVTKSSVKNIMQSKDFTSFRSSVEGFSLPGITADSGFHVIGHGGVGGEMNDPFTSINDPLFFLHHAGIDRVWAMWQELDLNKRLYDTGVNVTGFMGFGASSLGLETPIWLGAIGPDRPVRDVMDTHNRNGKGFLCYKYDKGPEMYH